MPRWWPWSHPVQVPAVLLHLGFEERELGGFTALVLLGAAPLCAASPVDAAGGQTRRCSAEQSCSR